MVRISIKFRVNKSFAKTTLKYAHNGCVCICVRVHKCLCVRVCGFVSRQTHDARVIDLCVCVRACVCVCVCVVGRWVGACACVKAKVWARIRLRSRISVGDPIRMTAHIYGQDIFTVMIGTGSRSLNGKSRDRSLLVLG